MGSSDEDSYQNSCYRWIWGTHEAEQDIKYPLSIHWFPWYDQKIQTLKPDYVNLMIFRFLC